LIEKYLAPINDINTIALDFLRALINAKNNNSSQYLENVCNCLAKFHTLYSFNIQINIDNLILLKEDKPEIIDRIR